MVSELEIKEKSQEEGIEKFQNRNQEAQIEEVKTVLVTVQRKEEQTKPIPYRHPNYNRHFDQRQDQNKHSQNTYVDKRKDQHAKQQLKRPVPQNELRDPIKVYLGWTTKYTM